MPGRDFETSYGPGFPHLAAGAFKVFGANVRVERAIGLLFRLLIVGGVFALVLYGGKLTALDGAVATALLRSAASF